MALSDGQKVSVSKLVGESLEVTKSALDSLARNYAAGEVAAVEAALIGILDVYEPVENKHLILEGGSDGIKLDYGRNRKDLRAKARNLLELPGVSSGLFRMSVAGAMCRDE
jgi:hypothetical protein